MKHRLILPIVFAIIICPFAAQTGLSQTTHGYQINDLDKNSIISLGAAFSIAENGVSVGLANSYFSQETKAAIWTSAGTELLPTLPTDHLGDAQDINESGVIVGESGRVEDLGYIIKYYPHAAIWVNKQAIELSTLVTSGSGVGLELKRATGINNKGQIVGIGRDTTIPALRSFLFDNGNLTDLGALNTKGGVEANDINELGYVVGSAEAASYWDHAFIWKNGVMEDLHDPAVLKGNTSIAYAVNEFGQVAGGADFISGGQNYHTATTWDNGVITDLGTLGGKASFARGINDHGTAVGVSDALGGGVHAFINYKNGKMLDLNDLIPPNTGWLLANAYDITNDGRVVGEGFFSGTTRPYILIPDIDGGFKVYGAGCAGSGQYTPGLFGEGYPTSQGDVSIVVVNGLGQAQGALLFGSGNGTLPFKPGGCDIQIMPLYPNFIPIMLKGSGPGAGAWQIQAQLPLNFPSVLITMQVLLEDTGAPYGFTVTNPLAMDIE